MPDGDQSRTPSKCLILNACAYGSVVVGSLKTPRRGRTMITKRNGVQRKTTYDSTGIHQERDIVAFALEPWTCKRRPTVVVDEPAAEVEVTGRPTM